MPVQEVQTSNSTRFRNLWTRVKAKRPPVDTVPWGQVSPRTEKIEALGLLPFHSGLRFLRSTQRGFERFGGNEFITALTFLYRIRRRSCDYCCFRSGWCSPGIAHVGREQRRVSVCGLGRWEVVHFSRTNVWWSKGGRNHIVVGLLYSMSRSILTICETAGVDDHLKKDTGDDACQESCRDVQYIKLRF